MKRDVYITFEYAIERATSLMSWGYRVNFYGDMQHDIRCWVVEYSK